MDLVLINEVTIVICAFFIKKWVQSLNDSVNEVKANNKENNKLIIKILEKIKM